MLADSEKAKSFVISLIFRGEEVGDQASPYRIGTLVEYEVIIAEEESVWLRAEGIHRVELKEILKESKPYLQSLCNSYFDTENLKTEPDNLSRLEKRLALATAHRQPEETTLQRLKEVRQKLSLENYTLYLCGHLPMPASHQQHLLESRSASYRIKYLQNLLDACSPQKWSSTC